MLTYELFSINYEINQVVSQVFERVAHWFQLISVLFGNYDHGMKNINLIFIGEVLSNPKPQSKLK